jgi:hypothetical protein
MIEISTHITHKGSIYYLKTSIILRQAEHVTTKMKFLLSHISYSLTYNLSHVLSHNCVLFSEISDKQS